MGNNLGKDDQSDSNISQHNSTGAGGAGLSSSSGAAGARNYPIAATGSHHRPNDATLPNHQENNADNSLQDMDISLKAEYQDATITGTTQQRQQRGSSSQENYQSNSADMREDYETPSTAPGGHHSIGEDSSSWGLGSAPEDNAEIASSMLQSSSSLVRPPPDLDDELVPTVFRWEHGGRQVYVTGTFNNWQKQIQMHRSGNDFTYIHNLKKGKHAFKFVVDDEWRFAPDQPTVADVEGRITNFIDVSDFDAYTGDDQFLLKRDKSVSSDMYAREIPDIDEYTKDPPPLPPHLRHIILNKAPPHGMFFLYYFSSNLFTQATRTRYLFLSTLLSIIFTVLRLRMV
mmetsp:Transcript_24897/g.31245  ORF Transcript_24897/g.31245 Transcript_24897/m.31245 type:complete len:344 (-) Transcript_24897:2558-3589(-)